MDAFNLAAQHSERRYRRRLGRRCSKVIAIHRKPSPARIHKQRVNRVTARQEQPIPFASAEAQVRAALRQRDVSDGFALGIEHPHAVDFLQVGLQG